MKPPAEKLLIYTIAAVACVFVLWLVIMGVLTLMFGMRAFG
jgi:hypothetical protein